MYNIKLLKKCRTFFNGEFVKADKRGSTDMKIEVKDGTLIHTVSFGSVGLRVSIEGETVEGLNDTSEKNIPALKMSYLDWFNIFNTFPKGGKYINISTDNDHLAFEAESIPFTPIKGCGEIPWHQIAVADSGLVNNAFCIASVSAGNGKTDFNNKAFFSIGDGKLKIINTNDIILQYSEIENVEGEDFIFGIENANIQMMKKWFKSANSIEDIFISMYGKFVRFMTKTDGILYEMIVPAIITDKVKDLCNCLDRIINAEWIGKKVELDEDDMYQVAVQETIAKLSVADKTKKKQIPKKTLNAELKKFTDNPNKIDAMKNLDKDIKEKVEYLSLANSIDVPNLYIQKMLYQNYMSAISEFDVSIYYLDTKQTHALMFGNSDDIFSFKTLFMLRLPKEEVQELPEDMDDDNYIEDDAAFLSYGTGEDFN
jgi:hypothetical protein